MASKQGEEPRQYMDFQLCSVKNPSYLNIRAILGKIATPKCQATNTPSECLIES